MLEGENFHGVSLSREFFPKKYGLVNWQYKSTSILQQNITMNNDI